MIQPGVWCITNTFLLYLDCGPIASSVSNGTVNQTGTHYADISVYWCDLGYMIEHGTTNRTLTCTVNGTWDGEPPDCIETGTVNMSSVLFMLLSMNEQ